MNNHPNMYANMSTNIAGICKDMYVLNDVLACGSDMLAYCMHKSICQYILGEQMLEHTSNGLHKRTLAIW